MPVPPKIKSIEKTIDEIKIEFGVSNFNLNPFFNKVIATVNNEKRSITRHIMVKKEYKWANPNVVVSILFNLYSEKKA